MTRPLLLPKICRNVVWVASLPPASRRGFAARQNAAKNSGEAGDALHAQDSGVNLEKQTEGSAGDATMGDPSKPGKMKLNPPFSLSEMASQVPASAVSGSILAKRFYKSAYAKAADDGDGYVVMLDHRILKTPAKKSLKVPSLSLAHAIAAEWEYQAQDGIRPFTMPLMKLTSTILDRVPLERNQIIADLLTFFHTDHVCCREQEVTALSELQEQLWDPLLDWVEQEFGSRPRISYSIFMEDQPQNIVEVMEQTLKSADDWQLAVIHSLSAAAKSLVVALAVFRGRLNVEEAVKVIRLEEDIQIDEWGLVEGGHDIDIADLKIKISAASVFLRLLSS